MCKIFNFFFKIKKNIQNKINITKYYNNIEIINYCYDNNKINKSLPIEGWIKPCIKCSIFTSNKILSNNKKVLVYICKKCYINENIKEKYNNFLDYENIRIFLKKYITYKKYIINNLYYYLIKKIN